MASTRTRTSGSAALAYTVPGMDTDDADTVVEILQVRLNAPTILL